MEQTFWPSQYLKHMHIIIRQVLLNLPFLNNFLQSHSVFVIILMCTGYKSTGSQQTQTIPYGGWQRAKGKVCMYLQISQAVSFSPTEWLWLLLCEWIFYFNSTCPSPASCPWEDTWLHRAMLDLASSSFLQIRAVTTHQHVLLSGESSDCHPGTSSLPTLLLPAEASAVHQCMGAASPRNYQCRSQNALVWKGP